MLRGAAGARDAAGGPPLALVPEPEPLGRRLLDDLDVRVSLHLGQLGLARRGDRGGGGGRRGHRGEVVLELLERRWVGVADNFD